MKRLALLQDTYTSKLLVRTIKKSNIRAYADEPFKKRYPGLRYISMKEAEGTLADDTIVYSNFEGKLPMVVENSKDRKLVNTVRTFKNKSLCRKIMSELFPEIYFKELKADEISDFVVPEGKRLIIKPSIGFFSVGIRELDEESDMCKVSREILDEVKSCKLFDKSVLNHESFLVEEFLEGEEYASDFYFDGNGEPVVISVNKHPFAGEGDFRDVVYYTNKDIVKEMLPKVESFLEKLSDKVDPSIVPMHMEYRELENGKICPIELNPLRFGGYTLADLSYAAFKLNPYKIYFEQEKPNWNKIFSECRNTNTAFVLARADGVKKGTPDHEKFRKTFSNIVNYREMDYRTNPGFATVLAQDDDLSSLLKYLNLDFKKYFK